MIFELPGAPGTFRERAEAMREIARQAKVPWLREIEQFSVVDRNSLQKRMNEVVKAGGEGLMLHRADALYETGRSDTLLKMKPWEDAEAVVIGHQPGKGKYAGDARRVARAERRRPGIFVGYWLYRHAAS